MPTAKSRDQLLKALSLLYWCRTGPDFQAMDWQTQENLVGVIAALEWAAGQDTPNNPMQATLDEIQKARAKSERGKAPSVN